MFARFGLVLSEPIVACPVPVSVTGKLMALWAAIAVPLWVVVEMFGVICGAITEVCYTAQTTVDAEHKLLIDYKITAQNDKKAMGGMLRRAKAILGTNSFTALYPHDLVAAVRITGGDLRVFRGGIVKQFLLDAYIPFPLQSPVFCQLKDFLLCVSVRLGQFPLVFFEFFIDLFKVASDPFCRFGR